MWGIHRDRWIPRTNGQLRVKCFHLMTSSCVTNSTSLSPVTRGLFFHWYRLAQWTLILDNGGLAKPTLRLMTNYIPSLYLRTIHYGMEFWFGRARRTESEKSGGHNSPTYTYTYTFTCRLYTFVALFAFAILCYTGSCYMGSKLYSAYWPSMRKPCVLVVSQLTRRALSLRQYYVPQLMRQSYGVFVLLFAIYCVNFREN